MEMTTSFSRDPSSVEAGEESPETVGGKEGDDDGAPGP